MRSFFGLLVILSLALLPACSDDTKPVTTDGPRKKDGPLTYTDGPSTTPDGSVKGDGQVTGTSALQAVVNQLTWPKNKDEFAYNYDGTGPKNALGAINGVLLSIPGMTGYDFQTNTDALIKNGNLILLLDVQATSIKDADPAKLQIYVGEDLDSPPNASDNFSGTEQLGVAIGSAKDMIFTGKITASKLGVGPGNLTFPVPIVVPPINVDMRQTRVEGNLSAAPASAVTEGRIFAVIPWTEVDGKIIPKIAEGIDALYKSGEAFYKMFDTNGDGTISADEVRNNGLLKLLLQPDIDTNNDKVADGMSVGLGFTAVGCTIKK